MLRAMLDHLVPLLLFAVVMCLTPGPNVVLATASAANFGFRRTIPQISGVTAGFGVQVLLAGLGLASLFQAEPRLHTALKYVGAAYLLYLAWRIATAKSGGSGTARARPLGFVEGVLVTWVNPKGWVTTIGALAAFTTVDGNMALQASGVALVLDRLWRLARAVDGVRRRDLALARASRRAPRVQRGDGRPAGALPRAGAALALIVSRAWTRQSPPTAWCWVDS